MTKYSSYILFLLICIFVVILAISDFGPIDSVQRSVNDFLCRVTASDEVQPNVIVVSVDTRAQNEYGDWPWTYDLIGDLVAAVGTGEPQAIVVDVELSEDARQDSAGYTQVLAEQLAWVNHAVLPYDIALAAYRGTKTDNPQYLFNNSIVVENSYSGGQDNLGLSIRKTFLPAERLLESKPLLGFDYIQPDNDQVVRRQPMLMYYDGYYYPSLPLAAAAAYLNLSTDNIKVTSQGEIELGVQRKVPIDPQGNYFVTFDKDVSLARISASDVLGERFDYSILKGQLVIIGVDEPHQSDQFTTPARANVPELWVKATVAENIINNRFLKVQNRAGTTDLIILFILGALGAAVLPRIPLLYRLLVLAGSLVVLANVNYFMVTSFQTLPLTVYVALQLMLFIFASPLLDSTMLAGQTLKPKKDKATHIKPAAPEKSRVDQKIALAAAPVRELRATASDQVNIKTTALEFPEQQNFYEHENRKLDDTFDETGKEVQSGAMGEPMPIPDANEELEIEPSIVTGFESIGPSSQPLQDRQLFSEPAPASSSSPVGALGNASDSSTGPSPTLDSSRIMQPEIKSLGRYQVTGVLGKGAMGTVYKGIDPAINRPVALKTIRLDFVNDPTEYEELKERLFREAQAAGKLSNPNIVTIYDVGSEGHLQYIAMEYLEGQTLEGLLKKKTKFNYRIIAQMITQICQALEYAHERGIVHRDIKPANIMVLSDYQVKVMDFGIARIDSNGMTKTGIAMGTPNYISPEQLKGVPIDRRADLFSLGVMMYEMLLGRRPFKGENITSLIYAILHNEPEKPSIVNPQVPLLFDHIIMRALKKVPAERYQKASEIASDLHDFVESFVTR